jgi:hypothetical protein
MIEYGGRELEKKSRLLCVANAPSIRKCVVIAVEMGVSGRHQFKHSPAILQRAIEYLCN